MEFYKAESILSTIKFLNFHYEIKRFGEDVYHIAINVKIPNTQNRKEIVDIIHMCPIILHHFYEEQQFIDHIFQITLNALKHEAGELFYVGEHTPYDEHQDNSGKWPLIKAMLTKEKDESVFTREFRDFEVRERESDYIKIMKRD